MGWWGQGLLGWINAVNTKGLGSRDLLFSSTLPSISLNPHPSPPHFPPPSIPDAVLHFAEGRDGTGIGNQRICLNKHVRVSLEDQHKEKSLCWSAYDYQKKHLLWGEDSTGKVG